MRKLVLLSFVMLMSFGVKAQLTSLMENFDVCDSNVEGEHFPPGWYAYNVLGLQVWKCYPNYGVNHSPAMEFNDYVAGGDNQDEVWLFTPQLLLSSYSSSVFLNFFAEYFFPGDSLHVMVSRNYSGTGTPYASGVTWNELSHSGVMLNDTSYNTDIFDEFQCDLSGYKSSPIYIAFKYTSTDTNGSRWTIDSVFTSTVSLGPIEGVTNVAREQLSLKIMGQSTPNMVRLECDMEEGDYKLELYDILGQRIYDEDVHEPAGVQTLTIPGLGLAGGMYIVKLGNDHSFGVAKTIVQ